MAEQEDGTEQIERAGELTITEFLEARIEEDEQAAKGAALMMGGGAWGNDGTCVASGEDAFWVDGLHVQSPELVSEHIVRHNPARVLAECAAKRAIIEDWEDPNCDGVWEGYDYGCALTTDRAARALAAVYSDHPDYQQEWARG
ncbi:hypothetical protein DM793_18895 [Paenarthrobacter nitroguajacolicus]|uniref:DUF6221 family protein n=1 Tax=Paenarthrobacter nitroguajacolicus TaxID=211146 RepID=UPI0015C05CF7|nr:DUF6221 family protein [Paenarthrobacter nitroguajacolicus]NWL13337.1 hypothetical protein [Paenarthrobacter nitroguajacolicus]